MILNLAPNPRYFLLILFIMGSLCAMSLFNVIKGWRADWQLVHQPVPVQLAEIDNHENERVVETIPSMHLFGQAIAKGKVPVTNLQLKVTGIVQVENKHYGVSKAYISVAGQPSQVYQLGESLPYGVKVYSINKNMVILENNGHLEKLLLPREEPTFKPNVPE